MSHTAKLPHATAVLPVVVAVATVTVASPEFVPSYPSTVLEQDAVLATPVTNETTAPLVTWHIPLNAAGVTELDAAEAVPVPAAFVAVTVKV